MIIGHRGASFHAPENTLSSAKLGWEHQADGVEIDIHLSKDNRIIVLHDYDTKRTTGVYFKVAETFSDTLRKLDAGSWKSEKYKGERIPYLEEILQALPQNKKLVIEIKCGSEVVPFLKAAIEKSRKTANCIIISFDFKALAEAKKALPSIPMYFLSSKLTSDDCKKCISDLKNNQIDGLDLNNKTITDEIAALCRQNNIPLLAWTVDEPLEAKRLVNLGVIGITTNKPLEMREGLKSLN